MTGHYEKVRAGQAGRRIIEEAEDMRASAIVIGLPQRVAGGSLFGKTLETVLADRPCRVVIESVPEDAGQRGARQAALLHEGNGHAAADGRPRHRDHRPHAVAGGDAGATGYILGVLFCLAGGLRLWFERRAPR